MNFVAFYFKKGADIKVNKVYRHWWKWIMNKPLPIIIELNKKLGTMEL